MEADKNEKKFTGKLKVIIDISCGPFSISDKGAKTKSKTPANIPSLVP